MDAAALTQTDTLGSRSSSVSTCADPHVHWEAGANRGAGTAGRGRFLIALPKLWFGVDEAVMPTELRLFGDDHDGSQRPMKVFGRAQLTPSRSGVAGGRAP